jgi:hypothetical protein
MWSHQRSAIFLLVTFVIDLIGGIPYQIRDRECIKQHGMIEVTPVTYPIRVTVVETILVWISGPVNVHFQETFCNGKNFTIYDNDAFVATIATPEPHFCGLAASSYEPIVSPVFGQYDYLMSPGQHNLTAVVAESPSLTGTLRITFFPQSPIAKAHVISVMKRTIK